MTHIRQIQNIEIYEQEKHSKLQPTKYNLRTMKIYNAAVKLMLEDGEPHASLIEAIYVAVKQQLKK